MRYTVTAESDGERNFKIGQHLPKLWTRTNKKWVFFSEHSVVRQQFVGKVFSSLFFRCQVSSGRSIPKIVKIGWLFTELFKRWCVVSTWLKISSNLFVGTIAPSF